MVLPLRAHPQPRCKSVTMMSIITISSLTQQIHVIHPATLVYYFIDGLKTQIRRGVFLESPQSLSWAVYWAKYYESRMEDQEQELNNISAIAAQNQYPDPENQKSHKGSTQFHQQQLRNSISAITDQQQQPSRIQFQIQHQHFRNLDQRLRSATKFITETLTNAHPAEGEGSCNGSTIVVDSDRSSDTGIPNRGFNDLSPRTVVATASNSLAVEVSSSSGDEAAEKAIPRATKLYTKDADRTTEDDDDLTAVSVALLLISGGEEKLRAAMLPRGRVSELPQEEKEDGGAAAAYTEEMVTVDFLGWGAMEARLKSWSLELFLVLGGGVALGEEEGSVKWKLPEGARWSDALMGQAQCPPRALEMGQLERN